MTLTEVRSYFDWFFVIATRTGGTTVRRTGWKGRSVGFSGGIFNFLGEEECVKGLVAEKIKLTRKAHNGVLE